MKQTQTKLFDFSDVGLDFCAGSKNLFPDRFKKILALGFNVQTVTGIAVAENQVTFTYGGAHGYVADRVLKIDSGPLSLINKGEFWIDSVTTNTVAFTLDNAPISVANGFTTRIAPLGWSLEYEHANVHIYKFKDLAEKNLYIRLVFQDNLSHRNAIIACIGKTADLNTGVLTDNMWPEKYRTALTPDADLYRWEFTAIANATHNNAGYTPAQFGKGLIVGSMHHFISMHNSGYNTGTSCKGVICGVLPTSPSVYDELDYPALLVTSLSPNTSSGPINTDVKGASYFLLGQYFCSIQASAGTWGGLYTLIPNAANSFLPVQLDQFQTTTAEILALYEATTKQHVGYIAGGLYQAKYGSTNAPPREQALTPSYTYDINLNSLCLVHPIGNRADTNANVAYFVAPIEELKIGYIN